MEAEAKARARARACVHVGGTGDSKGGRWAVCVWAVCVWAVRATAEVGGGLRTRGLGGRPVARGDLEAEAETEAKAAAAAAMCACAVRATAGWAVGCMCVCSAPEVVSSSLYAVSWRWQLGFV